MAPVNIKIHQCGLCRQLFEITYDTVTVQANMKF